MNNKFESPKMKLFIGPEVFKLGPELCHYYLTDCGSAPLNRPGKARTKLSPKDRRFCEYKGDGVFQWPWGVREWRLCSDLE